MRCCACSHRSLTITPPITHILLPRGHFSHYTVASIQITEALPCSYTPTYEPLVEKQTSAWQPFIGVSRNPTLELSTCEWTPRIYAQTQKCSLSLPPSKIDPFFFHLFQFHSFRHQLNSHANYSTHFTLTSQHVYCN